MYGPNVTNTLSLTKVLGGISRVLGIANQAIPLYKEIKPMVNNARKIMGVLKEFNSTVVNTNNTNNIKKTIDTNSIEKNVNNPILHSSSKPVFFQ